MPMAICPARHPKRAECAMPIWPIRSRRWARRASSRVGIAVYNGLLAQRLVRLVPADDPGASKTVMSGFLIRELALRAQSPGGPLGFER